MVATREIYWNVGHGVVLPMYLLALTAFGVLGWGFWRRLSVWRQGKPLDRCDRFDERVRRLARRVFGQEKVAQVADGGIPHALFFWGFLTLFVGTVIIMFQADFFTPLLHVNLLQGGFYEAYSLILDIAGMVAIIMLLFLLVRRFAVRPAGLAIVRDDYLVHGLLLAILITGFLVEGARMAATEVRQNPGLAHFSPGGLVAARLLFMSVSPSGLLVLHKTLWWVHFFLVLGFFCAIPFTKLRHIFTTSANGFLAPFEAKGYIPTLNLEDESASQFGAAHVADLTWKDLFDADACTSCKRCQDRCPAWNTEKPLSPMKVVQQIGEVAVGEPTAELCEKVTSDVLWACTTCRACQEICPADIEHVNKILEMRRNLTLMGGEFPGDEVRTAANNLEVNGNPFGLAFAGRGEWADGLDLPVLGEGGEADILYFVGCYASFDKRNREVARNFVRICRAAGVKVGILGKEETCCGEPARKLGNEYLYQMEAQGNIELMNRYGVKKVVTTCPHCFNTLARDYRDLGFAAEVEHYTTFIDRLLAEGKLALEGAGFDCTYHDSCYVGRYNDGYEAPRSVLAQAGGRIAEMEKSRAESFCCGGGGGRILAEERIGTRINATRVGMAEATGAPLLVSNCPFCLTMFEDGIKTGGFEEKIAVKDLAEIVAERIGG